MKLFTHSSCSQFLIWIIAVGAGAAVAAGPEDNFPPGGQVPAGWATSLGANAGWIVASDAANGGVFSLKSAPLIDDQSTAAPQSAAIQAGGDFGAGNVSFAFQVSSEANFDVFEFYIDGIRQLSASGTPAWTNASFPVAAGAHIFKWVYAKDGSNAEGSDAAWIDSVTLPSGTLQQLLNVTRTGDGTGTIVSSPAGIACGAVCSAYFATNGNVSLIASTRAGSRFTGWSGGCAGTSPTCTLSMSAARSATANFTQADDNFPFNGQMHAGWTATPGSNAPWSVATDSTNAGPFSLKSGTIANGQFSAVEFTTTVGAGTIDFAYKVSSETGYDLFAFYIDNVARIVDSGEVDWKEVSVAVAAGTHVFKFIYGKDASLSAGADAAWIDSVVLPFASTRQLSVSGAGTGAGTVSSTPAGINCGITCSLPFTSGSTVTLTAAPASGSIFGGWSDGCSGGSPTCQVVMDIAKNVTATFLVPGQGGVLDVDGSNPATTYDALTDGVLVLRYLFGVTGPALTSGALGANATRRDPADIKAYLDSQRSVLDVDGDGTVAALSDGVLILRYMFGVRGSALIGNAVGSGATRATAAAIETYIRGLMP